MSNKHPRYILSKHNTKLSVNASAWYVGV